MVSKPVEVSRKIFDWESVILVRSLATPSFFGCLPLCRHYLNCNRLLNWHNWPSRNSMIVVFIKPRPSEQSKRCTWLKWNFWWRFTMSIGHCLQSLDLQSGLCWGASLTPTFLFVDSRLEIFGELWEVLCKALGGSRLNSCLHTSAQLSIHSQSISSAQCSHTLRSAIGELNPSTITDSKNLVRNCCCLSTLKPSNMELVILSDSMIRTYREAFTRYVNFNIK